MDSASLLLPRTRARVTGDRWVLCIFFLYPILASRSWCHGVVLYRGRAGDRISPRRTLKARLLLSQEAASAEKGAVGRNISSFERRLSLHHACVPWYCRPRGCRVIGSLESIPSKGCAVCNHSHVHGSLVDSSPCTGLSSISCWMDARSSFECFVLVWKEAAARLVPNKILRSIEKGPNNLWPLVCLPPHVRA